MAREGMLRDNSDERKDFCGELKEEWRKACLEVQ